MSSLQTVRKEYSGSQVGHETHPKVSVTFQGHAVGASSVWKFQEARLPETRAGRGEKVAIGPEHVQTLESDASRTLPAPMNPDAEVRTPNTTLAVMIEARMGLMEDYFPAAPDYSKATKADLGLVLRYRYQVSQGLIDACSTKGDLQALHGQVAPIPQVQPVAVEEVSNGD